MISMVNLALSLWWKKPLTYSRKDQMDLFFLLKVINKNCRILSFGKTYAIFNDLRMYLSEGLIDQAHHDNNAWRANDQTLLLDRMVAQAEAMTSKEDTLMVVTADHGHVLTFGGTTGINDDLYGVFPFYVTLYKILLYCTQ